MPLAYHSNTGSLADPIVSNTAMGMLDPEMGGHPTKFAQFIQQESTIKLTPSMERGDLLHRWIEKPHEFVFSEITKPAPQMAEFSERFYELYFQKLYELNNDFLEYCKTNIELDSSDYFVINDVFKKLHQRPSETQDEVQLLIRIIFFSRQLAGVDKRQTPTKIIERFNKECLEYILFLQKATGKIACDQTTKNILTNAKASLERHPIASKMIFNTLNQNELELYWEEDLIDLKLKRKGKIDILQDFDCINIIDIKTTSKPVALFRDGAFTYYKLGRQLLNYGTGYKLMTNISKPINYYNVVVQTTDNFPVAVYKMGQDSINKATLDYSNMQNRLRFHIKNQIWDYTKEEYERGFIEI